MPLTFPTSPTNGQTVTLSGTTYTYNATKGVWEATASGGGGGGDGSSVTSYANLAAFPSSGNTAGDFGFATDTKFSYMWDGGVWQRMAMGLSGNAEPRWTTDTSIHS